MKRSWRMEGPNSHLAKLSLMTSNFFLDPLETKTEIRNLIIYEQREAPNECIHSGFWSNVKNDAERASTVLTLSIKEARQQEWLKIESVFLQRVSDLGFSSHELHGAT